MKIPHVLLRLVYQSTEKEKNSFSKSTSRRTDASRNEGNGVKNNEWEARKKIKCRGKKDVKEK